VLLDEPGYVRKRLERARVLVRAAVLKPDRSRQHAADHPKIDLPFRRRVLDMAQPSTLARSRCTDLIVIFCPVASFTA
jgi:hypothetical protein